MKRFWVGLLSSAVLAGGVASADDVADQRSAKQAEASSSERVSESPRSDSPRDAQRVLPTRAGDRRGGSPFWIGAMCVPAEPVLQAQLGLAAGVGLVVVRVMPESPADQAGLKMHDVVTKIDGRPAEDLAGLLEAVDQASEKGLKLEVVRVGKTQSMTVVPSKRPEGILTLPGLPEVGPTGVDPQQLEEHARRMQQQVEMLRDRLPEAEVKRLEEWLARLRRGENQPLRIQVFGPGVVMQGSAPANVHFSIIRRAMEPTKISISRGTDNWVIAESELEKLPEELRATVKALFEQAVSETPK